MLKGVFVDDQESELYIANALSVDNVIEFVYLQAQVPITELADKIIAEQPDIVALDYRLDEQSNTDSGSKPNRYKAGPVAQQLRDLVLSDPETDFPIIVVSQEGNIHTLYEPDLTAHNLFDATFIKPDIVSNTASINTQILGLIHGYKKIISAWPLGDKRIETILGAEHLIASSQDITAINQVKAPHQMARSILRFFILRSGLLLDEKNLIAMLGLDKSRSDLDSLFKILARERVAFTGAFCEGWPLWWKDKLNDWASKLCEEPIDNLGAQDIAQRIGSAVDIELVSATSRWQPKNENPQFSVACASCDLPTELDFSVPAYDPVSYGFIQEKIICWDCVEQGLYKEQGLKIDDTGLFITDKIENGEITRD